MGLLPDTIAFASFIFSDIKTTPSLNMIPKTVDEFLIALFAYSNWYVLPSWDNVVQFVPYPADILIYT